MKKLRKLYLKAVLTVAGYMHRKAYRMALYETDKMVEWTEKGKL